MPAPARPYANVRPNGDESIPETVWIRDARDRLEAIRATIEEESFVGDHVTAVAAAARVLLRAADVIDSTPDLLASKLENAAGYIRAEIAERTKTPAAPFGPQPSEDEVAREIEVAWRRRLIDAIAEELRERATEVERDAVEAIRVAEKRVDEAWDRAMGPAIWNLIEGERSAETQRIAIQIEYVREECRGKRMADLIKLFKGYVARGEAQKELMFSIAAATLIDEVRTLSPAKLEKRIGRGRPLRAGEIDREHQDAAELERLIEQRRRERIPADVLFARKALPILQGAFEVLLGIDQLYLSPAEFRTRFLAADGPARDPLEVASNWTTRNLLLPRANQRPLVGSRARGAR